MAFTAEDILGEFAEAQGYGERQGLGKHDRQREGYREAARLDHPTRQAHIAKRDARRKREWAEAKATRWTWNPGTAPPVPLRTRA